LHNYYNEKLGSAPQRECTIDWNTLQTPRYDLAELEKEVTEEEIYTALMQTPPEKSPGPDGYIGAFYKKCWPIIKTDLVQAIRQIFELRADAWELLNSANVTLIAKKEGAETIGDYRPISLMHSVAKLVGKIMANHLPPHLDKLVSPSQSAFIKGCSIHENFRYIQGAVKLFHRSKTPMLLLELDIEKAFDSVRWEYMLELMVQLGFGQRWRDLVALLWKTTSSRIWPDNISQTRTPSRRPTLAAAVYPGY
jgi:hypothetical protein